MTTPSRAAAPEPIPAPAPEPCAPSAEHTVLEAVDPPSARVRWHRTALALVAAVSAASRAADAATQSAAEEVLVVRAMPTPETPRHLLRTPRTPTPWPAALERPRHGRDRSGPRRGR